MRYAPDALRRLPLILLAAHTSACTLALDTDAFRTADASVVAGDGGGPAPDGGEADAGVDAGVPLTVDPGPYEVLEGLGALPEARATAVVITGSGLFVTARSRAEADLVVESAVPAADGTALGLAVRVPVDPNLGAGATKTVEVELTGEDGPQVVELTVRGLEERVFDDGDALPGDDNPTRYSEVRIVGGRRDALGPVRVHATSEIRILGPIDVAGRSDGSPGPGACAGGAPQQRPTDCPRGGDPGTPSMQFEPAGGGGGGNQTPGETGGTFGNGVAPGRGGEAAADSALAAGLVARTGAGGGGGVGNLSQGGGGGGGIALVSRGVIRLDDVDARGGPGATLDDSCARAGGGGGSGGAIVLRAWFVDASGTFDVGGGAAGGWPTCDNAGGAGGAGVTYLQVVEAPDGVVVTPMASRVLPPVWAPDTPVVIDPDDALTVRGSGEVWVSVDDATPTQFIIPANGEVPVRLTDLQPGLRRICLQVARDGFAGLEGRDCLAFAVVPRD